MKLEQRIDLLTELGDYMLSAAPAWEAAQYKASKENGWFTPEFIHLAVQQIATGYLQKDKLTAWVKRYDLPAEQIPPKTIGLIMAGNIPLVGFHDMLSIFVSGHHQLIKASTRDETLIRHLVEWMTNKEPQTASYIQFAERLNGCDAYIATGSNNSARYFDYYFSKYPNIIRRNRTSVAVLTGHESQTELEALADDVNQYFGLGCRNVTQIYVPENYDFLPLLEAFNKYKHLSDLTKYKHNYDYQLTLLILNKKFYMTNGTILLTENETPFSPISVLHYQYYQPGHPPTLATGKDSDIQCVVGNPGTNSVTATKSGANTTNHPPDVRASTSIALPTNNPSTAGPTSNNPSTAGPTSNTPATAATSSDTATAGPTSNTPVTAGPASNTHTPAGPSTTADQPSLPPSPGSANSPIPFGKAQQPSLEDYADGVDTLQFLRDL